MMWRAVAGAFLVSLLLAAPAGAFPTSTLAISQVYGGGGTASALFNRDYVELHNNSRSDVSLAGWSVQYASGTGSTWSVTALGSGSIPAGGYFLVALGTAGATGAVLPTADVSNTAVSMGSTAGKVALVQSTVALPACGGLGGSCGNVPAPIVDYIGYGGSIGSVYDFETAPGPALSAFLAAFRRDGGCTDTDDNSADFTAVSPLPRNSSTAIVCSKPPVFDSLASPYTVAEGSTLTFTVTATDADSDPVTISMPTAPTGADAATFDGTTHTFTWTPDSTRAAGSPYSVVFQADDGYKQTLTQVLVNVTDVSQGTGGTGATGSTAGTGGTSGTTTGAGDQPSTTSGTGTTETTTLGGTTDQTTTPQACLVPKLEGLSLKKAKTRLAKAGCKLGKVSKKASKPSARGKVVAQKPKPGSRKPAGSKVALTLGR